MLEILIVLWLAWLLFRPRRRPANAAPPVLIQIILVNGR